MQYVLDTVTVVRHFSEKGKIGQAAAHILNMVEEQNDMFVISVVSLMEILYLAEKRRIDINLRETLARIDASSHYTVLNLTPEILLVAETVNFPELHDRLILATAKWLDVPIISCDEAFDMLSDIQVIWK